MLEVGIGYPLPEHDGGATVGVPGSSLRAWRDYFPHAHVVGADINPDVLFTDERITTGWLNQLDPSTIDAFLRESTHAPFDLIIDDGLHEFEANRMLFECAIGALATGGTYVIEDCRPETRRRLREYFARLPYRVQYFSGFRRRRHKLKDNTLAVIRLESLGMGLL